MANNKINNIISESFKNVLSLKENDEEILNKDNFDKAKNIVDHLIKNGKNSIIFKKLYFIGSEEYRKINKILEDCLFARRTGYYSEGALAKMHILAVLQKDTQSVFAKNLIDNQKNLIDNKSGCIKLCSLFDIRDKFIIGNINQHRRKIYYSSLHSIFKQEGQHDLNISINVLFDPNTHKTTRNMTIDFLALGKVGNEIRELFQAPKIHFNGLSGGINRYFIEYNDVDLNRISSICELFKNAASI